MATASRKLFVNIVVNDLPRSMAFFKQLGFSFNEQFTSDQAASMIVSDDAYFMLHTPESLKRFTSKPPCDLTTHVAAFYAFTVDSRADVDALAEKALAVGGAYVDDPQDHGFMYQRSFLDPDGHHWEIIWMNPNAVMPEA